MRRERENCFDDRALSAWFNLPDVRAQRVFVLHSHATAYRDCRAVPGRNFRIALVCRAFPAADRARPASSGKSARSVGAYDSGRHRFQHSLYPHFHGARRFASGFARHDLVVSYGLECPILFCADPSTLTDNRNARDKAHKKAASHEAITKRDSQVTYDNEAVVRNAYHTAEGNVLDIPGWIDSFTEDGVFNNVTGEESYRGEHLKDVVIAFGQMFPDVSPRTSPGQCHGRCRRH
jgi:hypothetical protein